ncbi:MAG: inorganic diphosphatase, partial [Acidimicrobiales bacterium]|nr:inorganic diphosphatase [Acidimicrobiales bacterium]
MRPAPGRHPPPGCLRCHRRGRRGDRRRGAGEQAHQGLRSEVWRRHHPRHPRRQGGARPVGPAAAGVWPQRPVGSPQGSQRVDPARSGEIDRGRPGQAGGQDADHLRRWFLGRLRHRQDGGSGPLRREVHRADRALDARPPSVGGIAYHRLIRNFDRFRAHPWHGLPIGDKAPNVVDAFIEITPFDAVKYEIDKITGYLRVDRPQGSSALPPTLYGFIPRTYCGQRVADLTPSADTGDGDPLDICVLSQ